MAILKEFGQQTRTISSAGEIKYYYNKLFLDLAHKEKYVGIFQDYIECLTPREFLITYKELRKFQYFYSKKSQDWNWSDLNERKLNKVGDMPPEVWCWLAGHPNGYIREFALSKLYMQPVRRKMIVCLLSLNDHIPEIRSMAKAMILQTAEQTTDEELIFSLPFIQRLSGLKQMENEAIKKYLNQLLLEKPEVLLSAQQSEDPFIYRYAFELSYLSDGVLKEKSMENGLLKKDKLTLGRTFRELMKQTVDAEIRVRELMEHPQTIIRKLACEWCYNHLEWEEAMLPKLMDSVTSIRYLAKDYISKYFPDINIRSFYLEKLSKEPVIAVQGLSMLQNRSDKELLVPLIHDARKKLRSAVINWSVCLSEEEQLPLLYLGIMDISRYVHKKAVELLVSHFTPTVKEKLFVIFNQTDLEKHQISVIKVMTGDTRKEYLIDLFTLYPQSLNDDVRREIIIRINLWHQEWNRRFFVQFTENEEEQLKRLGEDFEELKVERFLG
ncbi:hypothetical protein IW492_14315 [Enterococcus sp. BWB1-3]|uniref:hypothetical protein n=1 Tax=unclassified Enterococcus TaxID=2608891 RepID=UPI00192170B8|nr:MULTISPECIES: hypothetical protein [unclassified Enterococcus]MBL1230405.1 hypothetical protein [Enterococcus sp. BWB1-3]MCB5956465.1 hypothetical protein [Enterococcus sp. CWB-B31]